MALDTVVKLLLAVVVPALGVDDFGFLLEELGNLALVVVEVSSSCVLVVCKN